ncbi:MAG: Fis family transcriptional regulator [Candidatus Kinetoplastibacterium crithidii]|uniref:Putative Fis-like DNA-binding protein n=1 Tax=Candidatus Kinetoplastidibacterium crithidiae TCC036E TaxID=1208918 RepID=M1M6W5_9PROT|nr:helix-turn-helix domain-containing protein [Candidatus Kinetoplastibacterium crithidii]AFZ82519.1 Fis family transcriptional regulator, factor for inversion stimulation protein [Candidatus Kinetoplastibacterium crithidii (ex Angomonas deanei ATCC 30255)]AGF47820.1 Fis family transcriptional regulator, factor for inversion [Candidatus Kinetoplastibacterium crithidii TCC036E]WBF65363.1 MAG: Fis family transcriptional regulator [Candidatus Kinetoplastibacterium crithidii]
MKKEDLFEECIRISLSRYLEDLGDSEPCNMLKMVMLCVEKPVIEVALEKAGNNQSKASEILGITRSTLRKKLIAHNI